jgi:hypothetical protein
MRTAYWAINQEKKETYMSKNLTRKSLAFGAFVALASTLISGAPASANGVNDGSVTIAPTTGTSYNALLSTDFKFNVNYVSGIAINGAKLSALVEDSTAQVKASFSQADVAVATQTFTSGSVVVQSATTADSAGASTADVLRLSLPSTVTATTAVGVTVWYDSDADKVIDANEKVATKQTVTFYSPGSITWAVSITPPVIGAEALAAKVTPSIALNGEQIGNGGEVTVDFSSSISTAQTTETNDTVAATYSADDKNWAVASTAAGITTVAAGVTFGAMAKVSGETVGTRVYTSVAAATAATTEATFVVSGDVAEDGKVRPTQRTVTLKLAVSDADGVALGAGIPVVINMDEGSGDFTGDVKVNGTVLADNGDRAILTDASGVATVVVLAPEDVVATDTVTISWAAVQGVATSASGGTGSSAAQTITWETAIYGAYESTKHYSTKNVLTTSGQSTSFAAQVVDQWGVAIPAGYYVKAAATGRTVSTTYTAISGGAVTVSIPDGAVTTGDTTVDFDIFKLVSGSYVAADGSGTLVDGNDSIGLASGSYTISYAAAATYTNTIDTGVDVTGLVSSDEIVAADTEIQNVAAPVSGASAAITGVIKNASTGATAGGALVTVKGTGLLFSVANKFAKDELTFYASSTGTYSVDVYANKVTTGTVVTVTSLGASDTETVVFTSSLGAKTLTVTAPAFAAAGTAVDVVATLADKWGNGVSASSLTLSSSGAGYLNATGSATTVTSGTVRAKLIFGSAETGSAVVTATTDASALTAANRTKTATVTIGAAPVAASATSAAIAGSTNRMFVSVSGNTLARNVVVKVAGRTVATLKGSTAAKKTYVVRSTKGSKKVTVFVGGKLIATKTVTVK